jgi:hypothetical protein
MEISQISKYSHKLNYPIKVTHGENIRYFKSKTQCARYLNTSPGCVYNSIEKYDGIYKKDIKIEYLNSLEAKQLTDDDYTIIKIKNHVNQTNEERLEKKRIASRRYYQNKKINSPKI